MQPQTSCVATAHEFHTFRTAAAKLQHAGARILFLLALGSVFLTATVRAETYTYPQLVERMTDLSELARLPPAGEKTSLASSYDRRSRYDAGADRYIDWGANYDGNGFIRKEGNEEVLAEINGPGCIWRIWSATAGKGHVKIYLDGSAAPAVDIPFINFFTGKVAPFNRPNIAYRLNGGSEPPGFDNYTPIPFAKSCKIVADPGFGNYYQFTYTQFPAGTIVPTFQMALAPEDAAALDRANDILGKCGDYPGDADPNAKTDQKTVSVGSGRQAVVADLAGPGAITALMVKLDLPGDANAQRTLLRQLTVSITWDNDPAPAVWSPLGDFFGYVGGAEPYRSLPLGYTPGDGFYSYWYMPFGKKARVIVGNDGPQAVSMSWQITHAPLAGPIENLARFHAKWHRDAFLPQRPDRKPDWTLLTTQGRGRYVGTHIHGWNPRGGWWGEGDDKFFVDGEKFPSSFGTGSEDYFGFAWSSSKLFSRPYHDQILNEGNKGNFDVNRWHIPDSVPFQQSLEACIEKYYSSARGTIYGAVAYWYLNAGGIDPYPVLPVTDRVGYWGPFHDAGIVIEGESLQPANSPVHPVKVQDQAPWAGHGWSPLIWRGGKQLFWKSSRGDDLDLPFTVPLAGKYQVILHCTEAPDYGTFQFSLDGRQIGDAVSFYCGNLALSNPTDLGVRDLSSGRHNLQIQCTGKAEDSSNTFFGLDYIQLIPLR
ncbi:MAG TPA: glycoside hydrolase family 172 protein [Chthoniobacteraceae bacterium]|jgi:hypothetical protein|nr:glycoside hydrolase family 172 protein [Chthoniobacteraceae bacterium]